MRQAANRCFSSELVWLAVQDCQKECACIIHGIRLYEQVVQLPGEAQKVLHGCTSPHDSVS